MRGSQRMQKLFCSCFACMSEWCIRGVEFMSIFKNVKLSCKLTLIGFAFVLPLGVLLYIAIANINSQIAFSTLETEGNTMQRPLEKLLEYLPRAAVDSHAVSMVNQAFAELGKAEAQYGHDLQFTPEGLNSRKRSHLSPAAVAARWDALKKQQGNAEMFAQGINALLDDVSGMITHCGDTSNLILDPDLDSYYTMDMTLLALPQSQRRIAAILAFGSNILHNGALAESDLRQFNTYAEMFAESDFSRIVGDTQTALNEDANFYGPSPILAKNLSSGLEMYTAATQPFIALLAKIANNDSVSREEFLAAGAKANDAAFRYWEICAKELDVLLGIRIASYNDQRLTMLAATGIALMLAVLLAYAVGRGVTRTIRGMVAYSNAVSEGDLAAALNSGGSTAELNKLQKDMQSMVGILKEKLGFVQGILGGIAAPCLVVDLEGRITFLNGQMCRFMALTSNPNDHIGKHLGAFFKDNAAIAENIMARVAGSAPAECAQNMQGKNFRGEDFIIALDVTPIFDLNTSCMGCFVQFTVLTELKQQEDKLLKTNRVICDTATEAGSIAGQVSAAAAELSGVVEQTGKGMEVQRSRVGEAATAICEMNASVQEIAQNAAGAADQAEQTMQVARKGSVTVSESVAAISNVQGQTSMLKERIGSLGDQVAKIGQIMNVISDIADQTNLLALNAAIEAARAGDAGRGFAVVADEVRKLAEKTMVATVEVGNAITHIRAGAQEAADGMGQAAQAVQQATLLADQSGAVLQEILHLAGRSAEQVRSIAIAVEQQSATTEEIHRAVTEVSHVAGDTAQGMTRSVQSVEQLASQAAALNRLIRDISGVSC